MKEPAITGPPTLRVVRGAPNAEELAALTLVLLALARPPATAAPPRTRPALWPAPRHGSLPHAWTPRPA
ncbi:acyl-CoA carboxylase epsilon subunit [Spirillospora sp. CA-294931]|uniref:acyl-CoA carboxylase epsilon subunit n=1 Tax=Spirillospora sp. CA-294931 TaxID=3240042 RepID=UPI003D90BBFF